MAITDIPEFVEVSPGDLIRSEDVNSVQRQARNSVRSHRHTRVESALPNDADGADLALQITTAELADGAVTLAKLADGAIPGAALPNGAVTGQRLAANAVGTSKLQDASVSSQKLQASSVASAAVQDGAVTRTKLDIVGIEAAPVSATFVTVVTLQRDVTTALSSVFIPVVTLTSVSAEGFAEIEARVLYRRTPSTAGTSVEVRMRLQNTGTSLATASPRALTFAPFETPPYGYGSLAAIGGGLL